MASTVLNFARKQSPFDRAVETYITKSNSPHTATSYRAVIRDWTDFLGSRGKRIPGAETDDMIAWRAEMTSGKHPFKQATVKHRMVVISGLYGYLSGLGVVDGNPFNPKIIKPPPSPEYSEKDALTIEQVRRLLATPDRNTLQGKRDYLMIQLMLRLALRVSSVIKIKPGDIRAVQATASNGKPILWKLNLWAKGGKLFEQPLPEDIKGLIDDYLEFDKAERTRLGCWGDDFPLFQAVDRKRGSRRPGIAERNIQLVIEKYSSATGIKMSPHSFRHTAVTRALAMGMTYHDVKGMTGHASILTVERYNHVGEKLGRSPVNQITY